MTESALFTASPAASECRVASRQASPLCNDSAASCNNVTKQLVCLDDASGPPSSGDLAVQQSPQNGIEKACLAINDDAKLKQLADQLKQNLQKLTKQASKQGFIHLISRIDNKLLPKWTSNTISSHASSTLLNKSFLNACKRSQFQHEFQLNAATSFHRADHATSCTDHVYQITCNNRHPARFPPHSIPSVSASGTPASVRLYKAVSQLRASLLKPANRATSTLPNGDLKKFETPSTKSTYFPSYYKNFSSPSTTSSNLTACGRRKPSSSKPTYKRNDSSYVAAAVAKYARQGLQYQQYSEKSAAQQWQSRSSNFKSKHAPRFQFPRLTSKGATSDQDTKNVIENEEDRVAGAAASLSCMAYAGNNNSGNAQQWQPTSDTHNAELLPTPATSSTSSPLPRNRGDTNEAFTGHGKSRQVACVTPESDFEPIHQNTRNAQNRGRRVSLSMQMAAEAILMFKHADDQCQSSPTAENDNTSPHAKLALARDSNSSPMLSALPALMPEGSSQLGNELDDESPALLPSVSPPVRSMRTRAATTRKRKRTSSTGGVNKESPPFRSFNSKQNARSSRVTNQVIEDNVAEDGKEQSESEEALSDQVDRLRRPRQRPNRLKDYL